MECYRTLNFEDKYDPEFEQECTYDPIYDYELDSGLAATVYSFSFETMKKIHNLYENRRFPKSIMKLYPKIRHNY